MRGLRDALSRAPSLPCQLLELRYPHLSILEHRSDLEPASHSFDVFGQGADTDVGPVLNLRDLSLIDAEDFGELQLRHLLRLAQLVERHSSRLFWNRFSIFRRRSAGIASSNLRKLRVGIRCFPPS
jgi:hypothetical protein